MPALNIKPSFDVCWTAVERGWCVVDELVAAYGEYEVETQGDKQPLENVLSSTDDQTYDSADDIRRRILELIGR